MVGNECRGGLWGCQCIIIFCSFYPTPHIYCLGFNVICTTNSPSFDFYRDSYQDVHACVCVTLGYFLGTLLLTWDIILSFFPFLLVSLEVIMFSHRLFVQLSSFNTNSSTAATVLSYSPSPNIRNRELKPSKTRQKPNIHVDMKLYKNTILRT